MSNPIVEAINIFVTPLTSDEKREVQKRVAISSEPGFDFYLLTVLSAAIATLGLLTDSAAVIIGAMLVAPLMTPILGISLASVRGNTRLLQISAQAVATGAITAIILAAVISWFSHNLPFSVITELPREVMSRTRPTPFDLIIAIAGGMAAAYAFCRTNLSSALPGVAIATALMPPLCTVGIGLSRWSMPVAGGALLLFITNLACIGFAGIVVFFILGYRPRRQEGTKGYVPRSMFISAASVLLVSIPLLNATYSLFTQNRQVAIVEEAVNAALISLPGVEKAGLTWTRNTNGIDMDLNVRSLSRAGINFERTVAMQEEIGTYLVSNGVLGEDEALTLQLDVIQGARLDPAIPPTPTPTLVPTNTPTPGPTPTSTATFTPTPTATPFDPTATATNTPVPTATQTVTPTPENAVLLQIQQFADFTATPNATNADDGQSVQVPLIAIRRSPGGAVIDQLPVDTPVQLFFNEKNVGGTVWVRIQLSDGRVGWVVANEIAIPTITPTPSNTPEPTSEG